MGILLDTSLVSSYLHERDRNHQSARTVMEACLRGDHGRVVATTFTLDELSALGLSRGYARDWANRLDRLMHPGPGNKTLVRLIHPSGWLIERAHQRYVDRFDQGLTLTDWVQIETMHEENLDRIGTFDQDFQGVVPVVPDPQNESAHPSPARFPDAS